MPDWTERLTEKERTDLHETDYESATTTELQDLHLSALRTVAALRALVEAKDRAMETVEVYVGPDWQHMGLLRGDYQQVRTALALTELQGAVKDCEHTGNCPCRPEECDVCMGTGEVVLVKHRPLVWARPAGLGQEAQPVAMSWAEASNVLRATILGYIYGSEEGEEMTCPECHGEGSLS